MRSIRASLVHALVRNEHFLELKLKKPKLERENNLTRFRLKVEEFIGRFKNPDLFINNYTFSIGKTRAEWITMDKNPKGKAILYIHGGGFVSGMIEDYSFFLSRIVKECGFNLLHFDYSLAPENKFPSPIDEGLEVYRWLLEKGYKGKDIVIIGDEAGGNIALSLMLAIRDWELEQAAAGILISPWLNLGCNSLSYSRNIRKDIVDIHNMRLWVDKYLIEVEASNPWVSPMNSDLYELPPLLLMAGDDELGIDDSQNLYNKVVDEGGIIRFIREKGMFSSYPLLYPLFPEAKEGFMEICNFIKVYFDY